MGERVLAVTSVDGVGAAFRGDGEWSRSGYVLDGGHRCRNHGLAQSNSEVAALRARLRRTRMRPARAVGKY